MLEQWIVDQLEPLAPRPLVIVRDPQRMIQKGAFAVDGWAERRGYTVLFCTGNLGLRDLYEPLRADPEARVLLVDRSRSDSRTPLFYPDLAVRAGPQGLLTLTLRDYLVAASGDPLWPPLVNERGLARLLLAHLPQALEAHRSLRRVDARRFTDNDLYKIVLGAALRINPFQQLSAPTVRRLCIEQHQQIRALQEALPAEVTGALRQAIEAAPRPFCWLLARDPALVLRAFTLAAILHQHGLDYKLLLSNLDPALYDYRDIDAPFLDQALADQLAADPERVAADVAEAEAFLLERPDRLAFLLHERLPLAQPEQALAVLQRERLSPLLRGLALVSLLADLMRSKNLPFHRQAAALLAQQANEAVLPALRRPGEAWLALETAYRRGLQVHELTARLAELGKKLNVAEAKDLSLEDFTHPWHEQGLSRLEYYLSDLERMFRVGELLPAPRRAFWPELASLWDAARERLRELSETVTQTQRLVDHRFQDFYRLHYSQWIQQPDAPIVFTHQFLPRLLQAHWDPAGPAKAVVMVFDGLRSDAWEELLRPVLEERYQVIASRTGSALLPTETRLSRKAIAAGCLPLEFKASGELDLLQGWLKRAMDVQPRFQVVKDDDTSASGMTVRYVSDRLEYIVFNFSDKNLHGNDQDLAFIYDTTVRAIIRQDVRAVLRELPADALLFIASDHGFAAVPRETVVVPAALVSEPHEIKYRVARTLGKLDGPDAGRVIDFDARRLGIPLSSSSLSGQSFSTVLFPRPGYTLQRPSGPHAPDRYTHGGLSLAECLVPMVVMGRRQEQQLAAALGRVRQAGSVSEGEPLALEITVQATQIGLSDLPISLSFSRPEIPGRRELFSGPSATYSVAWTPALGELSDAERAAGLAVLPVTVILGYSQAGQPVRLSQTVDVRVKLDPNRLRRRLDSKMDLLMGKMPR